MTNADKQNRNESGLTRSEGDNGLRKNDKKVNGRPVQKAGAKMKPQHHYHAQRASRKPPVLYIVLGASVLSAVLVAVYVSAMPGKAWAPVPEAVGALEPTPVRIQQPPPQAAKAPEEAPVRAKKIVREVFTPNAVIDVPNVVLRKTPLISGPTMPTDLRRGDRVEIVKRFSGAGPSWVSVKTKSGLTGWVFASVVKEPKRR